MENSRIKFAEKSLHKARKFRDPFIKFIVLWIGLNALYGTIDRDKKEYKKIKNYFKNESDVIFKILCNNKEILESIGQFINNTSQHSGLKEFLKTRRAFFILKNEKESVNDFVDFLTKVRNNMFHAEKIWDEKDEAKLLLMVYPILEKIIDELIKEKNN